MAAKLLLSEAATRVVGRQEYHLMVEVCGAGGEPAYAKLERSLYGTRDAPQIWQDELRSKLEMLGFQFQQC